MNPGKSFKLLHEGDVIKVGDEFLKGSSWEEIRKDHLSIGHRWSQKRFVVMRRRKTRQEKLDDHVADSLKRMGHSKEPECYCDKSDPFEYCDECVGHDCREAELNLDNNMETARALHHTVRSMHDGHCPACLHLGNANDFHQPLGKRHQCPNCGFVITDDEAKAALKMFKPFLQKSLDVFKAWKQKRDRSKM